MVASSSTGCGLLKSLLHLTAAALTLLAQCLPQYMHDNCFLTEWEHLLSRCKTLNKKNQDLQITVISVELNEH